MALTGSAAPYGFLLSRAIFSLPFYLHIATCSRVSPETLGNLLPFGSVRWTAIACNEEHRMGDLVQKRI